MAETTQEPIGEPSDTLIATLWAQLQALYAARCANRVNQEGKSSPDLDLRAAHRGAADRLRAGDELE